jgi:hypothetical protein
MNHSVDDSLIRCAARLAGELERELAVPAEMLPGPEVTRGYAEVARHEDEVVLGLASWLGELPTPDFRAVTPPIGPDPLISCNLGELLPDYGISAVYLVAEAVLRLYRPYLLAALALTRAEGKE